MTESTRYRYDGERFVKLDQGDTVADDKATRVGHELYELVCKTSDLLRGERLPRGFADILRREYAEVEAINRYAEGLLASVQTHADQIAELKRDLATVTEDRKRLRRVMKDTDVNRLAWERELAVACAGIVQEERGRVLDVARRIWAGMVCTRGSDSEVDWVWSPMALADASHSQDLCKSVWDELGEIIDAAGTLKGCDRKAQGNALGQQ